MEHPYQYLAAGDSLQACNTQKQEAWFSVNHNNLHNQCNMARHLPGVLRDIHLRRVQHVPRAPGTSEPATALPSSTGNSTSNHLV